MNKVWKRSFSILGVILLTTLAFMGGYFTHFLTQDKDLRSLEFILDYYKKFYYEEQEDIIGIMSDSILDKYSEYYSKEEYELLKKASHGSREGLGITININNLTINNVAGNSPAEKVNIKRGSKIIAVKTVDEANYTLVNNYNDFSSKINSIKSGVSINLKLELNGQETIYTLAKQEYKETFVFYTDSTGYYNFNENNGNMEFVRNSDSNIADLPQDVAYLRYSSFSGLDNNIYGSAEQFNIALNKFKENKNSKLIIDLRGNGGGYMNILCSIASHLICDQTDNKKVLVSKAIYKNGKEENFISEKTNYFDYNFKKIIFLANENSASASEALMGATLDYDKKNNFNKVNVILSDSLLNNEKVFKSYGKGIMQTTFENIGTGEAIKLTTAKIFWPVYGVSIHGVGLTPNLDERILGVESSGNNIDNQLNKAIELCKKVV